MPLPIRQSEVGRPTSTAGVRWSHPAVMKCPLASALPACWNPCYTRATPSSQSPHRILLRAIVSPFPDDELRLRFPWSSRQMARSRAPGASGPAGSGAVCSVYPQALAFGPRIPPSQKGGVAGAAVRPHASTHTHSRGWAPAALGLLGSRARCNLFPLEGSRARSGMGNALSV